jgi:hypothetical protein
MCADASLHREVSGHSHLPGTRRPQRALQLVHYGRLLHQHTPKCGSRQVGMGNLAVASTTHTAGLFERCSTLDCPSLQMRSHCNQCSSAGCHGQRIEPWRGRKL